VELRHLRYFRVVAQELHFGRAAARLHMEPQPLNFQMKQLERELGFRLFSHRESRTRLTAAGERFLDDVEPILEATERAVDRAAQVARGEAGTLRIGFPTSMAHLILAPGIKHFRENYPETSFELRNLTNEEQLEALLGGRIDLGLGILPFVAPGFEGRAIARARLLLAVSPSDVLARESVVTWNMLDGRNAVTFDASAASVARTWVDTTLAEHDVVVREIQTAVDIDSALAFAAAGMGLTIVAAPAGLRPSRTDVTFVDLPADAGEMDVDAVWLHGDENPLRDRFVEMLGACVNEIRLTPT
jgi:DNA-binding transcriptional LysR family regulator